MKILTLTMNPCVDRTLWVEDFGSEPESTELLSGGKGVNVARVLTALGEDCVAVAPVAGETGTLFEKLARAEGISLKAVPVSGNTRTIDTYARISDCAQQVTRELGPALTEEDAQAVRRAVLVLLPQCSVLAVCGSAPCPTGAKLARELMETARAMGVRTLLDSSGEALIEGVEARPDVLKINESELAQLLGASDDPLHGEATRLTVEKGVGRVLLTLGERGCVQYLWEQAAFCPAPIIRPVNPVGSGDCFTAAWLHAQIRGFSDDGAMALGCAAGAANALRFPAACITRADIESIVGFQWN